MSLPAADAELVQIMDAALADAARRAGPWLVCRPGCTQCCHGAFAIGPLDTARLQTGMAALRNSDRALAARIEQRARAFLAEHGPAFPGDTQTGALATSDEDRQSFEEFANDAPCPALDPATGLCDVYAWRPMTCRVFGPPVRMEAGEGETALAACELCFIGASEAEIAACEMTVPHEFEAEVAAQIPDTAETIVAFALLR